MSPTPQPPAQPPPSPLVGDAPDHIPRVAVVQDGARLHYAVPAALEQVGMLAALYTNFYNDSGAGAKLFRGLTRLFYPAESKRMAERRRTGLAGDKVFDAKASCLALNLFTRTLGWTNPVTQATLLLHRHKIFDRGPLARAGEADVVFAFSHMAPAGLIRQWQKRGLKVIIDQPIAPMAEWIRQSLANENLWPGWEAPFDAAGMGEWGQAERATLLAADHITCASDYVRDGLVADGLPTEKITVIPYPFEVAGGHVPARSGRAQDLTVGFCGEVGLRKGAPWFLEVAKLCSGKKIRFVMVGRTKLRPAALAQMRQHVQVVGPVSRSQVQSWLERFDIFLFPSTCEGSPGAVMEAMATGLPIVTTPNSGTVVREGVDGYIAPYDQPEVLAQRVLELAGDPEKRLAMGQAAAQRAREFSIDFYSREISKVIYRVLGRYPP